MLKYLSFVAALFATLSVYAQQSTLSGSIQDGSSKQPIELATIAVRSVSDTTKVYGTKSKEKGLFSIPNIPYGTYRITFSMIGYMPEVIDSFNIAKKEVSVGKQQLLQNDKILKAVNIVGEKNTIELGIDKKTFNVDKNITSAGGTATDLLRNVPSVNVDMDGNVNIRGKDNVTLLVDGKPSSMFGSDPQTILQNIPASSIESIEVITNPSAKYDAQGMSGIINIVLKKDRKAGYNALINAGIATPYRLNGGINFNANKGKWNFFLNANGRQSETWEETTNTRSNYDDSLTFSSFTHNDRKPLSGFMNAGAEYTINKKNKIILSQNIFNAKMRGRSTNTIENEINFSEAVSSQVRLNSYVGNPLSSTTNLQFKHQFDQPKEELNVELNFSKTRYIRQSTFNSSLYDSSGNFINSFVQQNPVRGGNWNGTIQLDYTRPLTKTAKLDIGQRSYIINFKSENHPTIQYLNQPEIPEIILKNHFNYDQQVHALYANYANQFKKTGVQVGLRGEYFRYDGFVHQYNASVSNDYLSLFPTLFIARKLSKKEDLNFNYARRVNRPGFMQIIPFIDVSNPQDTSMGNPNLRPEFIHSVELTYNYQYGKGNTFLASTYYQYTNDLIQRYRRFNDDGTTFSQNQNLATGITYGVEATNRINILSWWEATFNVNLFRNIIDGANLDPTLTRSGFGGFAKVITNVKLKHQFSVQMTANYNARTVIAQGSVQPYGFVDFAVKKVMYNGLANFTLTLNDAFNTLQTETFYNLYPFYNQRSLRKNLTRVLGLNLQIRLASKSQRNNPDAMKKPPSMNKKEKETKNREENLKKDEGGGDDGGGGGR